MKKLKFLFSRIFSLNYGAFFKNINEIHKETKKSRIWLFFDMIHCGIKYGAGHMDYRLCSFYDLTPEQRATYVTRGVNNAVVGMLNDKAYVNIFEDKREFNKTFADFIGRKWIDMKNASKEEFFEFAKGLDVFISKPADDCCGRGVEKIKISDYESLDAVYDHLVENGSGIAEEFIVQHHGIAEINPYSVNSLRVVTVRVEGVSNLLYAFIRIGNGRAIVDNINNGGMAAPIDLDTGVITHPGYDKNKICYDVHPDTGCKIVGREIPFWKESAELCLKASAVVPQVGYVGWDVAVTEKGPILIEGNPFPGHDILQMPPHVPDKIGMLPRYKKFIKGL